MEFGLSETKVAMELQPSGVTDHNDGLPDVDLHSDKEFELDNYCYADSDRDKTTLEVETVCIPPADADAQSESSVSNDGERIGYPGYITLNSCIDQTPINSIQRILSSRATAVEV